MLASKKNGFMNKRIILYLLPVLLLLAIGIIWVSVRSAGETEIPDASDDGRNIYVGDIISLKIASFAYSADELALIFQGFEIIDMKDEPDGYLLSLRTFTVGERKILLGNKEIIINVSSTLNDIERDSIFQGDTWVIKPGFSFYWRIMFYIAAGCCAISGGFVLAKAIRKRKENALSPLQLFMKRCAALSPDDDFYDGYFVDLTFYFKKYLEARYQCRIIGKTSAEIIDELQDIQEIKPFLLETQDWLTECDRLKFSGVEVSAEKKKEHCALLLNLVERIDRLNEEAA